MIIRLCEFSDAAFFQNYYQQNSMHLAKWEPLRSPHYHSLLSWQSRLVERAKNQRNGTAYHFIALDENAEELIAACSLTSVVRGPFMACNMGYSIASKHEGQGRMKTLCQHAIQFAFAELKLHRIMANHMPVNERSAALLKSLGFAREGLAKSYLKINDHWEDHVLNSLINPHQS